MFVGIVVACGLVGVKNAVGAVAVEPTVGTFVDLVHICRGEAPLAKKPACETITVVDHFQRTVTLSRHSCVRAELLAAVSVLSLRRPATQLVARAAPGALRTQSDPAATPPTTSGLGHAILGRGRAAQRGEDAVGPTLPRRGWSRLLEGPGPSAACCDPTGIARRRDSLEDTRLKEWDLLGSR